MPNVIISNDAPQCPLCGKRMKEVFHRGVFYYTCLEEYCMISIRKDDPCCGRWNEKPENAPTCPICKRPMKMFFRIDKFMIVQCRNKEHQLVQIARGDASHLPPLEDTAPHG